MIEVFTPKSNVHYVYIIIYRLSKIYKQFRKSCLHFEKGNKMTMHFGKNSGIYTRMYTLSITYGNDIIKQSLKSLYSKQITL